MLSKLIHKYKGNQLLRDTLVYGLTNALYSGLPFLLLPFLVTVLEPEDYGMVDLFRSLSMVLVPILGLSAVQSIGRYYFDLDERQFKLFVSSIQIFQLGVAILATVLVLLLGRWIDDRYRLMILLCIAYFFFKQFVESLLIVFRVTEKAKNYMVIRLLNIVLELGILFVLYNSLKQIDWTFRVYPMVLSIAIVAFVCLVQFRKLGYKIQFSKDLLKTALLYSTPLILHMMSGYVLNIGDRFFIKYYLNAEALGNYAVAYQIGMAINFIYTSFNLAWVPTYFKWMKEHKFVAIYKVKKTVYIALTVLSIINIVLWLIIGPLIKEYTNYEISTHIVIVVLVGNVVLSFYKFESNYFLYNKKTKKLSSFTLFSAIVSVILNIILIPLYGTIGAAYASLFSFIVIYGMVTLNRRNDKNNKKIKI